MSKEESVSRSISIRKEIWEEATRICGKIQSRTGVRIPVGRFVGELIEKGLQDYDPNQYERME